MYGGFFINYSVTSGSVGVGSGSGSGSVGAGVGSGSGSGVTVGSDQAAEQAPEPG